MAQTLQKGQTADPGLRPGMAVEVLSLENSLIRVTRVESYQNGAVILRDAKGDNLPRMVYNQELKLRFFHNGEGTLLLGRICGSTDQIWKVDRMESKFFKEQRAFFRQRMTTRALGKCHRRSARGVVAKEGYPCRVLDVSAGGAAAPQRRDLCPGGPAGDHRAGAHPVHGAVHLPVPGAPGRGAGAGAGAVRLPVRGPAAQGTGPAPGGHLHRPAGGDPAAKGTGGPVGPPVLRWDTRSMENTRPRRNRRGRAFLRLGACIRHFDGSGRLSTGRFAPL